MAEQGQGPHQADLDAPMVEWEGGEDLDGEFQTAETCEVKFDSDDDVEIEDDDDLVDDDPDAEVGVVKDSEVYGSDCEDDDTPVIDDALTSVAHKEAVLTVALSPADPRALVTGGQDDVAVLWTMEERGSGLVCTQRCRLEGHTDSVTQVAFSHDGKYIATGSYDGTIRIWAGDTGVLQHALEGPTREIEWILWHPKGHAILAGSVDTMAWMWWAPTGKLMQIFAGHAQSVNCGCWCMGGKIICTGSEDRSVIAWNPRAGSPQQHVKQVHESAIISICSHPEAPVVVTGSEDATAKVIQVETGKVLKTLEGHTDSVECIQFNNLGGPGSILLLATASMDGNVMIWDARDFSLRCTLKDHFERGGITAFKWLPAPTYGSWLCTSSTDKTLRYFNALNGQCVGMLRGHRDTVLGLDLTVRNVGPGVSGARLLVASCSDDKSCRLFVTPLDGTGPQSASGSAGPSAAAASTEANASASASAVAPDDSEV